jgi:hypothetical protein
MSRMSDLHADLCNVVPLHPGHREPCAELGASLLAERAALLLMCSPDMARGYRAEIVRAAADGDPERVFKALNAWRMG